MPAVAQVNVRMDAKTKAAGDAALASIGLSPSRAVRAVWQRAAQRGESLQQLDVLLNNKNEKTRAQGRSGLQEGRAAMEAALQELGLSGAMPVQTSDSELLEEALLDRLDSIDEHGRAGK